MGKKTLKHLDLFSGYGGFTIPASKYGIETINFSEIDKYATAVLKYRFPSITNLGDITKIKPEDLPDVDIITGGSPCQDLSVAGKGAGLDGGRSGLFFCFINLIKEKQPMYFVWENVKGALSSSKGWDFARVQIEMEQAGYDVWWQVINAKDFGVPQNRERIFAIGIRKGSGREILFEQRNTKQNIKKLIDGAKVGSRQAMSVYSTNGQSTTLASNGGGLGAKTGLYCVGIIPESIKEKGNYLPRERIFDAKGNARAVSTVGSQHPMYAVGSTQAHAAVIYRGRPNMPYEKGKRTLRYEKYDNECPALTQNCAAGDQMNMVAVDITRRAKTGYKLRKENSVGTITSTYYKGIGNAERPGVIVHNLQPRSPNRPSLLKNKNAGGSGHLQREDGVTYTVDTGGTQGVELGDMRIRRLTPTECERLMGLEDGWTSKGIMDGKEVDISDTQRYKMCGNGVVVNCVDYIYNLISKTL